jgi:hypothetical protein
MTVVHFARRRQQNGTSSGNSTETPTSLVHEQLMHTRTWKGQSNFTLERFIAQHRNASVSMQAAAEHVMYQIPNSHSRVGYLLDAIQCSDAGLQAAMANIKTDQGETGLCSATTLQKGREETK